MKKNCKYFIQVKKIVHVLIFFFYLLLRDENKIRKRETIA